jgi:hypothetical protein
MDEIVDLHHRSDCHEELQRVLFRTSCYLPKRGQQPVQKQLGCPHDALSVLPLLDQT